MGDVRLHLLGRFRVHRDGAEIPPEVFGGRKVRTLLRVLAVRRPDLVTHDVLAEALWPDRSPADPAGNLNVLVNRARRALGDPALVVTGAGGYALGACAVDVDEFLGHVAAARRVAAGDSAAGLRAAASALALWAEPLAEDAYADWARGPRARLLQARVDALELAARAALALGEPGVAAGHAADAAAAEPLRESATLLLARALAAGGDRAAALTRLAELQRRLADELGVDLSPEAAELQLSLLRGGPAPARQVATSAVAPAGGPSLGGLLFVGRDAEVAVLRKVVADRGVAAVGGVAGVGKSRLITEALRGSALPVIAARAFLPERAEAWGLTRSLLREALAVDVRAGEALPGRARDALAGLVPELGSGRPAPLDGESRRALLLASALRVLEAVTGDGAVLVVDDLQWADASSLALLGSALARLPRLAGVLAFRTDELPAAVLAQLRDARVVTDVPLQPLSRDDVATLVGDPELADALVAGTDGTPFEVTEVLRELVARDAVLAGPTGWRSRGAQTADLAAELGHAGQRRAVRRRARRHAYGSDVLALVALLAREAAARTIATAAGIQQRAVLDELSRLAQAGLLRLGEQGWAAAHDLVGETVVADLSPGQRGRLHGLLARALEAEDAEPSEIARHHREAGDPVAAAAAYERAARAALDAHATREAAALAGAGVDLRPRAAVRAGLLEVRAEARAAHADLTGALADLHEALRVEPGGPRARRLARLAMLTFGAQDPRRAAEAAELALVLAGQDDPARALALETAAILDMNIGPAGRAADRSAAALELYRRLGDARGVARILDGQAMATFLDGRITAAVDVFERVAQLFTDSGELLRVVTPRSTRGHGLVFLDRPVEGLAEASTALRLARDLDAPEGQTYALWHRSEALSALGRGEEAEADAQEALTIARTASHRGWTATAHRARGIALQARGLLDDAASAFAASAVTAGQDFTLFASWAAARGALVAIVTGRLTDADPLVRHALTTGPPLGHYEGRLAAAELAAARDDPDRADRARTALAAARAGGHLTSVPRLAHLAEEPLAPDDGPRP